MSLLDDFADYRFEDIGTPNDILVEPGIAVDGTPVESIELTKGIWRFWFGDPVGSAEQFSHVTEYCNVNGTAKEIEITEMIYYADKNQLAVTVDIKENPIPLIIIYGVVFAVAVGAGALATNSVLDRVEKVTVTATNTVFKSPFVWASLGVIALIYGLPKLTKYRKVTK